MHRTAIVCAAVLLVGVPHALAQGIRTISADEQVSVALKAFSRSGEQVVHGSTSNILLDQDFEAIGPLLGGPDVVEARWSEVRGFGENIVRMEFRTRDGGAFVPADMMIGDEEAEFIGWEIGRGNPIEFLDFAGDIEVNEYKVFVSEDAGTTFNVFDLTASFDNPWDGTDFGRTLPLRTPEGAVEYNTMIIEYQYTYTVPAPAGLGVLGALGLAALRRRRPTAT